MDVKLKQKEIIVLMKKSSLVQLNMSILDKLTDNDVQNNQMESTSRGLTLVELRMGILRDLGNLLNTKIQWVTWPVWYKELKRSLLNYGLVDLSGVSADSEESQRALCERMTMTIEYFEPRLSDVSVEVIEGDNKIPDKLQVNISAMLYAASDPEYISFDSSIDQSYLGISIMENMT